MIFFIKPPTDPLAEDLRLLDHLEASGLKIERL
jgi:hypothetical protein